MNEIKVTQSNTGTYTVNFECSNGEELSKTNARLLFEESAISEVIDDLNMHRGDHALLVRIAELEKMAEARKLANRLLEQERNELEAERDRLREALKEVLNCEVVTDTGDYSKGGTGFDCNEVKEIIRGALAE